jgi:hypothetical protein
MKEYRALRLIVQSDFERDRRFAPRSENSVSVQFSAHFTFDGESFVASCVPLAFALTALGHQRLHSGRLSGPGRQQPVQLREHNAFKQLVVEGALRRCVGGVIGRKIRDQTEQRPTGVAQGERRVELRTI